MKSVKVNLKLQTDARRFATEEWNGSSQVPEGDLELRRFLATRNMKLRLA
jgi:hypothetical protein